MSHQIIKFNEAAALAAGWPKDLCTTMRHLVRSVGVELGQMTLPEAVEVLEQVGLAPIPHAFVMPDDPLTPAYCAPILPNDLAPVMQTAQQVEFLQTEVRQMAEQIAVLTQQINDLQQGKP